MYSSTHNITVSYKDINGIIRCTAFMETNIYTLSTYITGISAQGGTQINIQVADPEPEEFTKENIKWLF